MEHIMDLWTFVILIVIIIVAGDVVKNALKGSQANNPEKNTGKEIEKIKLRIDELDRYIKYRIEQRLQAIETIVVDSEYNLDIKFKRMIKGD